MYGENGYLAMVRRILNQGMYRKPEDEEGRYELFAETLKFDLRDNKLPLFTTKATFFKGLAVEMLWFLSGSTNIDLLAENNVKIWDVWANEDGEVGPLYGFQWRHWRVDPAMQELLGTDEIDQIAQVMNTLRDKPEARSHMVTAWRPDHLKAMSIKPCHSIALQFYRVGNEVSAAMYQRSCDTFLGVPFNVAQFSLLTHMVAHQLGCTAREFTWVGGDVHIYENHMAQMATQARRMPGPPPRLTFKRSAEEVGSIDGYRFEDFQVEGYTHQGKLSGAVSAQGQPGQGVNLETLG